MCVQWRIDGATDTCVPMFGDGVTASATMLGSPACFARHISPRSSGPAIHQPQRAGIVPQPVDLHAGHASPSRALREHGCRLI